MKKISGLSCTLLLVSFFIINKELFSQNVGIGIINPTRAKLEVNGAVGFTTAIFGGESTGISLQRNWPSVGFNQYYDGSSRYIGNGYAAVMYVDPGAGYMAFDMFGSGTTNSTVTSVNRSLTLTASGNVGIKSYGYPDISLFVPRLTNASGALVIGGSTHNSRFYYGANEDTYLRGGKNSSTLFINDIPNGDVQMGVGSTKVGINTLPYLPLTALEINGAIALRKGAYTLTSDNMNIGIGDRSYITVNNLTSNHYIFTISDGMATGQLLIIQSAPTTGSGGGTIRLFEGPNVNLSDVLNYMPLNANNTLMLIWTGSEWLELNRSQN